MQELNIYGQTVGKSLPDWLPRALPQRVILKGEHCLLEPIDIKHSKDLYEAWYSIDDERDWTYFHINRPITMRQCDHYIASLAGSKDPLFYSVISNATRKAVGFIALQRIEPENGAVEIGWINWSPLMKRTLCSTEAIFLLLSYVLDTLQYRRCAWKCDSLHQAAIQAAERLGFQYEGTFRQKQISKGRSRDTRWYSIIDNEWPGIRQAMQLWLSPANLDDRGKQKQSLAEFMPQQK
ncbi:GNAT family N-acetyltransferase [Ewingella americana]|jgi:RimJ/RimL family protein N-acetyltransferase|uniref:N-acetyltransferase n=1 Tax=Ewingella americana TaxID=41202 RepID=A0A502GA66_9GAMM|nr:GNAT family protein [Ewingella americana]TPG58859.1 N-acetyltransferase [Ewingella americana]